MTVRCWGRSLVPKMRHYDPNRNSNRRNNHRSNCDLLCCYRDFGGHRQRCAPGHWAAIVDRSGRRMRLITVCSSFFCHSGRLLIHKSKRGALMQTSDVTTTWQPSFVDIDTLAQARTDMVRRAKSLPRGAERSQQLKIARYFKTQIKSRMLYRDSPKP
jgi:hypothetical protein